MNGPAMRGVAILGSTGSVGEHTLDVIARHPDVVAQQGLGRGRPEQHEDLRADEGEFGLDPREAGADLVTIHPSAVLRARGQEARAAALAGLIDDLRVAAKAGD